MAVVNGFVRFNFRHHLALSTEEFRFHLISRLDVIAAFFTSIIRVLVGFSNGKVITLQELHAPKDFFDYNCERVGDKEHPASDVSNLARSPDVRFEKICLSSGRSSVAQIISWATD